MNQLINRLVDDFPQFTFKFGQNFHWSPVQQQISYNSGALKSSKGIWALFHELGHATLGHKSYKYDFELLAIEIAAWQKALELAKKYGQKISQDHVQDCLDSYREWLHCRSTCPACLNRSVQQNSGEYSCFNCHNVWQVSASRFCRPYRKTKFTDPELLVRRNQTFFV
ncbi:MAG: hypothetical protein ACREGF_02045 [Candidatus Saccharimonadales bacterium]